MEKIIETYRCVDSSGNVKYIDEYTYSDNLRRKREMLLNFIEEVEKNCPSNDIDVKIEDVEEEKDSNSLSIAEDKIEIIKENKLLKKIRNVAFIATLSLGFLAFGSKVGEKNIDLGNRTRYTISNESVTPKKTYSNIKKSVKKKDNKNRKISNLKIGSNIKLDNVKLKYTSLGDKPVVNTDSLSYTSYRINSVSIIQNREVKEVVKPKKSSLLSTIKSKFKNKYGTDIDIEVNVDGYIDGKLKCKNVGWTSISNLKNKTKVKKR